MLSPYSLELYIAKAINGATNGTYRAPTFAANDQPYSSGNYYSIHSFVTAGYYDSQQTWNGTSSVVMKGDPIMAKNETGTNRITTGSGNDFIYSATGSYLVARGNAGNDAIFAHNKLDGQGGEGNDVLVAGVDIKSNASGNPLTAWKNLLANAENMTASALDSHFTITNSKSTLYGDEGHDKLIAPGDGDNTLYGDGISPTAADGNDVIIAGNGNNLIYGGGGNDTIYVGSGQNEIYAGTGDDVVYADAIGKTLDGGDGFDVYSFAFKDSDVNINAGFWGTASNFEAVVGSKYNDTIVGNSANNQIDGYSGNDSLNGGSGNDSLIGGTGNDFYFFSGAFGSDYIFENAGEGTDDRLLFDDLTFNNMLYGRNGNDLMIADASATNIATLKDWFVNFGVDSFWFTTGTVNQYDYVTAEGMAAAFGVTIPTGNAAANTLSAIADAPNADIMMNAGDNLAQLAVTVIGVDLGIEGTLAM